MDRVTEHVPPDKSQSISKKALFLSCNMSLLIPSLIFSVNEIVRRSRRARLFSQTVCSHPFKPTPHPEKEKRGGGDKFEDPVVSGVTECSCLAVRSPLCFYGPVAAHSFLISVLEISRGITREEIVRGELFLGFFLIVSEFTTSGERRCQSWIFAHVSSWQPLFGKTKLHRLTRPCLKATPRWEKQAFNDDRKARKLPPNGLFTS